MLILNYKMSLETGEIIHEANPSQSLETMPYFMWSIDNICSDFTSSPTFTVMGVNFSMVYNINSLTGMCKICISPSAEYRHSGVEFNFNSSVSVIFQSATLKDTYFTYKEYVTKGKKNTLNTVWLAEHKKLYKLVQEFKGEHEKDAVTFLCVFGPLSERLEDVLNSEGTWCNNHCLQRRANDLQKFSLSTDTNIVLKCGKDEIKAHENILSARSGKLADMFRSKKAAEKEFEIADMTFEVLDNFVSYIYCCRLKDMPSEDLLTRLYETAVEYRVDSLKIMTRDRLVEMFDCILMGNKMDKTGNFSEEFTSLCRRLNGIADKYCDDVFKAKIRFCGSKASRNMTRHT